VGLEPALREQASASSRANLWHDIVELVRSGAYERAASRLHIAQTISEREENHALAAILTAAHHICLACRQHSDTVVEYREAQAAAARREQLLQEQLFSLLSHFTDQAPPPTREPAAMPTGPATERTPAVSVRYVKSEEPAPEVDRTRTYRDPKAADTARPSLSVYCLGRFRVYENGRLIDGWTGNKSKSILKYMITHRERPMHRDVLIDRFWRADDPEAARRSLYQTIYVLRQALQGNRPEAEVQYILCENSSYLLNPAVDIWVDSDAFLEHVERGRALERVGQMAAAVREYEAADNLYEGDFLAEELYEEWPLAQRENLKVAYLDVLDRLSRYHYAQRSFSLCITYCQKILQADGCREDAHRRLMRAYMQQGQRHLALRQYHRCVEALQQELEVQPVAATLELYRRIKENPAQI